MRELAVRHDGAVLAASYSPGRGHGHRRPARGRRGHPRLRSSTGICTRCCPRWASASSPSTGAATGSRPATARGAGSRCRPRTRWPCSSAVGVRRVGLWGLSQGGWIAPLAAAESPSRRLRRRCRVDRRDAVRADDVRGRAAARARGLRARGRPPRARAASLRTRRTCTAARPVARTSSPPELQAAMDEPWWLLAFLPPVLLDAEGCRLWIEEMDFDPRPVFAARPGAGADVLRRGRRVDAGRAERPGLARGARRRGRDRRRPRGVARDGAPRRLDRRSSTSRSSSTGSTRACKELAAPSASWRPCTRCSSKWPSDAAIRPSSPIVQLLVAADPGRCCRCRPAAVFVTRPASSGTTVPCEAVHQHLQVPETPS